MKDILLETVTKRGKSEYGETELVLPALSVIAQNPSGIDTSELIRRLEEMLSPTGHDANVLSGRRDTYFSQKVRNLKSHNKLKRLGVATYDSAGMWRLTEKGEAFVEENLIALTEMSRQGFTVRARGETDRIDYTGLIIEEGGLQAATQHQIKRSQKLKRLAVERFMERQGGRIFCEACTFDFDVCYSNIGRGYIELHHLRPLYLSKGQAFQVFLNEALTGTRMVCANCHRMLHRRKCILPWDELCESVRFVITERRR
jgi:predicted HNH restriction endonuclease